MNKVTSAYLIYGVLISVIGVIVAISINGPSKALILALGFVLIYRGIRARNREVSEREYLTMIAALSPGIVHMKNIYGESRSAKDLRMGIVLAIGFFGSILFDGYAFTIKLGDMPIIGCSGPYFMGCLVLIGGCYEISTISVNQYCDEKGYPCTDEMFGCQWDNPSRLIRIVAVATIILAIAATILMGWVISLNPE